MSVSIGTSYIIHPTGISTFVRTSSHHERHPIESSTASCVTTVPQIRKQASVMLSFPDMLISHAVNLPTRYFPKKKFFFLNSKSRCTDFHRIHSIVDYKFMIPCTTSQFDGASVNSEPTKVLVPHKW